MKKLLLALIVSLLGGCGLANTRDVTSGGLVVQVIEQETEISVSVSDINKFVNQVATDHCVTLDDATTITVNGVTGRLVKAGGLPFDANSCEDAMLIATLPAANLDLAIVLEDSSGQLHVDARYWFGLYQISRCDADDCSVTIE